MIKENKIKRTIDLLRQSLNSIQTCDSDSQEAKSLIQKAIAKLDNSNKRHSKNSQNQAQKWWGNIISGITASPMSKITATRSLEQLNKMAKEQQLAIDDIEVKDSQTILLKD